MQLPDIRLTNAGQRQSIVIVVDIKRLANSVSRLADQVSAFSRSSGGRQEKLRVNYTSPFPSFLSFYSLALLSRFAYTTAPIALRQPLLLDQPLTDPLSLLAEADFYLGVIRELG